MTNQQWQRAWCSIGLLWALIWHFIFHTGPHSQLMGIVLFLDFFGLTIFALFMWVEYIHQVLYPAAELEEQKEVK